MIQIRRASDPIKIQSAEDTLERTCTPNNDTISKQRTRSSWPIKSIRAECIGSAYISGSSFLDHRKLVRALAMKSEAVTYNKGVKFGLAQVEMETYSTTEEYHRECDKDKWEG